MVNCSECDSLTEQDGGDELCQPCNQAAVPEHVFSVLFFFAEPRPSVRRLSSPLIRRQRRRLFDRISVRAALRVEQEPEFADPENDRHQHDHKRRAQNQ